MKIALRPIAHLHNEYAMGHCVYWPSAGTDAVSCTYNPNSFTPMTAVLRELNLTTKVFGSASISNAHRTKGFRVISHGDERPLIITSSRTDRWADEPNAAYQILNTADIENCESLCMTHFAFILGRFPIEAFTQCVHQVIQAKYFTQIKATVIDVDQRHIETAQNLFQKLNRFDFGGTSE